MRHRTRLVLGACAGLGALALAAPALATYTPKIEITPATPTTGTAIHVTQATTDDPTAKLKIYTPLGYTADLTAAPGTSIGTVQAKVTAADLAGAVLPLEGTVTVASPADFAGPPNNSCVPGTHQAVWLLVLTAAGQTLRVPAYVDAAAGDEAALASYVIQVCLPPPDVPVGTPGRATFGAKLFDASFNVNVYTAPPTPGEYRWRALWTPYHPYTPTLDPGLIGMANAAGTVETQALVRQPTRFTMRARYDKRKKVVNVNGSMTENGVGVGGAKATILSGASAKALRTIGSAATDAAGAYKAVFKLTTKAKEVLFGATAALAARDFGAAACAPTFGALNIQCISATANPIAGSATPVKVKLS